MKEAQKMVSECHAELNAGILQYTVIGGKKWQEIKDYVGRTDFQTSKFFKSLKQQDLLSLQECMLIE